jgi:hypothetical protein
MSRNLVIVLIYHWRKLLDIISAVCVMLVASLAVLSSVELVGLCNSCLHFNFIAGF